MSQEEEITRILELVWNFSNSRTSLPTFSLLNQLLPLQLNGEYEKKRQGFAVQAGQEWNIERQRRVARRVAERESAERDGIRTDISIEPSDVERKDWMDSRIKSLMNESGSYNREEEEKREENLYSAIKLEEDLKTRFTCIAKEFDQVQREFVASNKAEMLKSMLKAVLEAKVKEEGRRGKKGRSVEELLKSVEEMKGWGEEKRKTSGVPYVVFF